MITKYIKGDILTTELKIICQGVNCQNVMGSGVARVIYERYPKTKTLYHKYAQNFQLGEQNKLLGEIQAINHIDDKTIINCFTQLNYGNDGKKYVNYAAIVQCFKSLTENFEGDKIAIPKIGAGLAGGNWEIIEQIINDATGDDLEVWVYEL